jgi:hypothetical protein
MGAEEPGAEVGTYGVTRELGRIGVVAESLPRFVGADSVVI